MDIKLQNSNNLTISEYEYGDIILLKNGSMFCVKSNNQVEQIHNAEDLELHVSNVKQQTGDSTLDLMSQKATTDAIEDAGLGFHFYLNKIKQKDFTLPATTTERTYTCTHNFGYKYPFVNIIDKDSGQQVYGEITYIDNDSLKVAYSASGNYLVQIFWFEKEQLEDGGNPIPFNTHIITKQMGNGTSTSFTYDCDNSLYPATVRIIDNTTKEEVFTDIKYNNASIVITTAEPPTQNQYTVYIKEYVQIIK